MDDTLDELRAQMVGGPGFPYKGEVSEKCSSFTGRQVAEMYALELIDDPACHPVRGHMPSRGVGIYIFTFVHIHQYRTSVRMSEGGGASSETSNEGCNISCLEGKCFNHTSTDGMPPLGTPSGRKVHFSFCQVMKEPNKGTVSKILSTKIIAGYKMATAPSVKAKEQPGLEPICIGDNKYRIKAGSTVLMFHCKETGIKFEMQPETTIEYALDYEEEYIKLIEENGYELLGPIFNVEVISGRVSAVYLPHYVRLEGFRGEKSIKYGHFKDGKVTLQTPTRIENSYVVLENPTFCGVAVVGKPIPSFFKSEKYPFDGRVQIFARVLCPEQIELTEYKIHLYLIPADGHIVKKLNDLKDDKGFQMIEKPSQTSKVYQHKTYTIRGEPEAKIKPTTLEFLVHKDTGVLPFTEITISKNAILRSRTPISLRVGAEGSSVWDGELSRAEIEELTRKANKGDFIHKNRPALIQDVKNIKPVLDDLLKKDLLKKEQYEIVTSRTTPQEQMRSLLSYVESWGREDQSTFYEVLKKHNKSTIKKIENGN